MTAPEKPRVVIVGAGFGGLWAAQKLAGQDVDVLMLDKNNYHTFLPLLYQVAAAELEPERIAQPVRSILRGRHNVDFAMAEVREIDPAARVVYTAARAIPYDYLIVATGSTTNTFGIPGVEAHCYPLKTIQEGVTLRNQILECVELAAQTDDPVQRRRLLTFVIVGGGPTGVEYAGALAELLYHPLEQDYARLDLRASARVVLVEAFDKLLSGIGGSDYTVGRLNDIGVEVRLNTKVSEVTDAAVYFEDGSHVDSETIVWSAGVRGVPLAEKAGLESVKGGQVPVRRTLQAPQYDDVYVVGDMAYLEQDGRPLPWVAQLAMQMGEAAAENILRQTSGRPLQEFHYRDKGTMATVGRNSAVANISGRLYTGFVAWLLWLGVHLFFLIGFRNRLGVLTNWAWNYVFYDRVVRLILPVEEKSGAEEKLELEDRL